MIVVITKFWVKPDMVSEFKDAFTDVADGSRKEADCFSYQLCKDLKQENLWYTLGTWKSEEALHEHMTSLHVRNGIARTAENLDMDPEWTFCEEVL